jgi:hypothetical protein
MADSPLELLRLAKLSVIQVCQVSDSPGPVGGPSGLQFFDRFQTVDIAVTRTADCLAIGRALSACVQKLC